MAGKWNDLLSKIPTTQRPANGNTEVVNHPGSSFDKLARDIANANNQVVILEGAVEQLEIQIAESRGQLNAELTSAQETLANLRLAWDKRCDALGVRGVLPAAVTRPEPAA